MNLGTRDGLFFIEHFFFLNFFFKKGTVVGSAPEQGSFPIDRLHECDQFVEDYFGEKKKKKIY